MLFFIPILIAIILFYVLECVLVFIYRKLLYLSRSKTNSANSYKTIYSALIERTNFSYNKHKGYSNNVSPYLFSLNQNQDCHHEEERRSDLPKFRNLFLCAFVPLWLACFSAYKTFNFSFRIGSSFYSSAFSISNKIITIFKSIKAA
jgi:hypothetical protein